MVSCTSAWLVLLDCVTQTVNKIQGLWEKQLLKKMAKPGIAQNERRLGILQVLT